jgi:imidazolonepropionase-like amidohydrolase
MTPAQAIRAATLDAATVMGWQDKLGTLETGRFADMIAVEGNPLTNVRVLERVQGVIKAGVVVK